MRRAGLVEQSEMRVPKTALLHRKELGLRLQPDGLITVIRTVLLGPEFAGAGGNGFVGDYLTDVHTEGRRRLEGGTCHGGCARVGRVKR
jgi:hypothetical protein